MNIISRTITNFHLTPIILGIKGDNGATRIDIDVSAWDAEFPGATYEIVMKRMGDPAPYIAVSTYLDGVLSMIVTGTEVSNPGRNGYMQVVLYDDGEIARYTPTVTTIVYEGLSGDEDIPYNAQAWVNTAVEAKFGAIAAMNGARQALADMATAEFQDLASRYSAELINLHAQYNDVVIQQNNIIGALNDNAGTAAAAELAAAHTPNFPTIADRVRAAEALISATLVHTEQISAHSNLIDRYISGGGNLYQLGNNAYCVRVYAVEASKTYKFFGTARIGGAYPIAGFKTTSGISGAVTKILDGYTTNTPYDFAYKPPQNGYVFVAYWTTTATELLLYDTAYTSSRLDGIEGDIADVTAVLTEVVGDSNYEADGAAITPDTVYNTYYITGGGSISTLGASYTSYNVKSHHVQAGKTYILKGTTRLNGSYPIAGFKTTDSTTGSCTVLLQGTDSNQTFYLEYTPSVDGYVFIADTSKPENLLIYNAVAVTDFVRWQSSVKKSNTPGLGKKLVVIGTSVDFGQYATKSFVQEAADALGYTLINASVPGLAIHTNADGSKKTYGSSALTIAEYASQGTTIAESPITPYVPGGSYNSYYRTWEHVFTAENADADLYLFDVVPNNDNWSTNDWDAFEYTNWKYADDSPFSAHRTTFLGALLFLMDKMYAVNPSARMAFLLSSSYAYSEGKTSLNRLKDKWNIPIIDLWGKINLCPPSKIKLKSEGGTNDHPSTFAHEVMGKMLAGELRLIG